MSETHKKMHSVHAGCMDLLKPMNTLTQQARLNLKKDLDAIKNVIIELNRTSETGKLSDVLQESLGDILDLKVASIQKLIGYAGEKQEEVEQRYAEIRSLHQENRRLKDQLGQDTAWPQSSAFFLRVCGAVSAWWHSEGFSVVDMFVRSSAFGNVSITMKLSTRSFHRDYVHDDAVDALPYRTFEELEQMLDISEERHMRDKNILDTEPNRLWFTKRIRDMFPTAWIQQFENRGRPNGHFELTDIHVSLSRPEACDKVLEEFA